VAQGARLDVFSAAGLGKLQELRRLLKRNPKRATARTASGNTPLHFAAAQGQVEAARVLLAAKADPDAQSDLRDGQVTPLSLASLRGHADMLRLLLKHGANLRRCPRGETLLHWAARARSVEVCRVLLQHGADPN